MLIDSSIVLRNAETASVPLPTHLAGRPKLGIEQKNRREVVAFSLTEMAGLPFAGCRFAGRRGLSTCNLPPANLTSNRSPVIPVPFGSGNPSEFSFFASNSGYLRLSYKQVISSSNMGSRSRRGRR